MNLLSGPKMPTLAAQPVVPTENTAAIQEAQQQQAALAMARSGRAATFLSQTQTAGSTDKMGA